MIINSHLTATTALKQLDSEFEAVSASLKVSLLRTMASVTVPVCLPAIARHQHLSLRQRDDDGLGGDLPLFDGHQARVGHDHQHGRVRLHCRRRRDGDDDRGDVGRREDRARDADAPVRAHDAGLAQALERLVCARLCPSALYTPALAGLCLRVTSAPAAARRPDRPSRCWARGRTSPAAPDRDRTDSRRARDRARDSCASFSRSSVIAEPGSVGHADRALLVAHRPADDHVVGQVMVMRVRRVAEVRHDGAHVQHRRELDAELAGAVDGDAEPHRLADARGLDARTDAAPERRVEQDDVDGAATGCWRRAARS